ncbi:MAG TPA: oxygenase MpaB family protein [Candidatus Limnocylindria bacterium]|nr:oxygenase MpaB family protein [Candidatus Limnocylindria bacterium]
MTSGAVVGAPASGAVTIDPLADAAGLFGPDSVSWRVDRELVVLAGGSCALLMQAAHPSVAAGVAEHSTYATDPFGRLMRTLTSSFDVVFGTRSEAEATIRRVNAIHAAVRGRRPDGEPYSALEPEALLWVHATLVDTALRVHDRFVAPLSEADAQRYHEESAAVAIRLGVPPDLVPPTIGELRAWMDRMLTDGPIRVTPQAREIARTVLYPTRFPPRIAWDAAHLVSMATLPSRLRREYGIGWSAARERGVRRIAAASRRLLPLLPSVVRHAPQARAADRRVRQAGRAAGSTR